MKVKTLLAHNGSTKVRISDNEQNMYRTLCYINYMQREDFSKNEIGILTVNSKYKVPDEILDRKVAFIAPMSEDSITIYVK